MERKVKKSILIALVLGNGCVQVVKDKGHPNSKLQGVLKILHLARQKVYLEYKAKLIHSVLGGKKPKVNLSNNNVYPKVYLSKSHRWFRYLRNWIYINGEKTYQTKILKHLTPEGLAIWYMDKGSLSLKKRDGKIHSRELFLNTHVSKEENQVLIDYFLETWSIKFYQVKNKGSYRLGCGTKEAKKFIEIIKPHIIPSMVYKIDMKYSYSTNSSIPNGNKI